MTGASHVYQQVTSNSVEALMIISKLPIPVPYTYTISDLTQDDVEAILEVCRHIGGTEQGVRGTFSRLGDKLRYAGIKSETTNAGRAYKEGSIYFRD